MGCHQVSSTRETIIPLQNAPEMASAQHCGLIACVYVKLQDIYELGKVRERKTEAERDRMEQIEPIPQRTLMTLIWVLVKAVEGLAESFGQGMRVSGRMLVGMRE